MKNFNPKNSVVLALSAIAIGITSGYTAFQLGTNSEPVVSYCVAPDDSVALAGCEIVATQMNQQLTWCMGRRSVLIEVIESCKYRIEELTREP